MLRARALCTGFPEVREVATLTDDGGRRCSFGAEDGRFHHADVSPVGDSSSVILLLCVAGADKAWVSGLRREPGTRGSHFRISSYQEEAPD